jgi:hypothetical protein
VSDVRAPDALWVECPTCAAKVRAACYYQPQAGGPYWPRDPHPARVEAARAAQAASAGADRLWIQTVSGVAFPLVDPTAADIRARDIAHALAGINRFGGHLRCYYSVAQHSVLAASLLWQRTRDRRATLAALLHDAHEAYTGDIKKPVKAYLEQFAPGVIADLEHRIDAAIAAWACLELGHGAADVRRLIKTADLQLLFWERDRWMPRPPRPWFGEDTTIRLTVADFGVEAGSPLLDPWSRDDAEEAFRWCLDAFMPDQPTLSIPGRRLSHALGLAFKGAV